MNTIQAAKRGPGGRFVREEVVITTSRLNDNPQEIEAITPGRSAWDGTSDHARVINAAQTREQWLNHALELCREHIQAKASQTVPASTRVSCGFPGGGSARKRIGECWPDSASADASTEIFISPTLDDTATVLSTLLHEAIHAAVGCAVGHKGPFKRAAIACGLIGKMTATEAGPELLTIFDQWSITLGAYPHARLSMSERKKQTTRLVKCTCPSCGYVVRTTAKWIMQSGAPLCPTCEAEEASDRADGRIQMITDSAEEDVDNS